MSINVQTKWLWALNAICFLFVFCDKHRYCLFSKLIFYVSQIYLTTRVINMKIKE
jgi:hypothetical protein